MQCIRLNPQNSLLSASCVASDWWNTPRSVAKVSMVKVKNGTISVMLMENYYYFQMFLSQIYDICKYNILCKYNLWIATFIRYFKNLFVWWVTLSNTQIQYITSTNKILLLLYIYMSRKEQKRINNWPMNLHRTQNSLCTKNHEIVNFMYTKEIT